jgi:hypothetical protein
LGGEKKMGRIRKLLDDESMIHYLGVMFISMVIIGAVAVLCAAVHHALAGNLWS